MFLDPSSDFLLEAFQFSLLDGPGKSLGLNIHGTINRGDMFQLHHSIRLEQLLQRLHTCQSLVAHALPHDSGCLIDRGTLHSVEPSVLFIPQRVAHVAMEACASSLLVSELEVQRCTFSHAGTFLDNVG